MTLSRSGAPGTLQQQSYAADCSMPIQPHPNGYDDQHQHQDTHKHKALGKLQAQRLQRAGQRLHSKQLDAAGQPTSTSDAGARSGPTAQPINLQKHQQLAIISTQQLFQQQRGPAAQPAQPAAPARLHGSIIATGRVTTKAGRGMQSKPPSRAGSLGGSVELQEPNPQLQQQQQHDTSYSSNSCSRALSNVSGRSHAAAARASSSSSGVALAGNSTAGARNSSSACQQAEPQLLVSGTGVQFNQQQQQQQLQAHPESATAARQQRSMARQHLPCAATPCSAPSLNLGCGVPWSQLTAQSALVAKRSLHHTKREQEQQRWVQLRFIIALQSHHTRQKRLQYSRTSSSSRHTLETVL